MKFIPFLLFILSMVTFAQERSGGTGGKGGNGEADTEKIVKYFLDQNYIFHSADCNLLNGSGKKPVDKVCGGIGEMISNGTSSYDHEEVYYKCCPYPSARGVIALNL